MSISNNQPSDPPEPTPPWDEQDQELMADIRPHAGEWGLSTSDTPPKTDDPLIRITLTRIT